MSDRREQLLTEWAARLDRAAAAGALTGDPSKPIVIRNVEGIAGPRAGVLHIDSGLDAGRLLRAMTADDGAVMRQFIPWVFPGTPACYMSSRHVRLEAGWSDDLSERKIKLADLNIRPHGSGQWIAGKNELGRTVTLSLDDQHPHFLVSGATGSGKSWALRALVVQLARHGDRLALIDGKMGEGLRDLDRLPGVVGPMAIDAESARAAIAWTLAEMVRRYERQDFKAARLVVVIDEVQELIDDAATVEMLRRLAAQGRAARIHLVLATQHPVNKAFGDPTIKRNVTGRVALRVADAKSSEVAIGQSTPRADWLLGAGDAYAVVPGAVHRLQVAYVTRRELDPLLKNTPALEAWPTFEAEQIERAANVATYNGAELAVSLVNAHQDGGRPALVKALEAGDLGKPGAVRAERLLRLGREQRDALTGAGWTLCENDADCLPA